MVKKGIKALFLSAVCSISFFSLGCTNKAAVINKEAKKQNSAKDNYSLKEQKVLFISSYSLDWSSVPPQIEGIESALMDNVVLTKEYMNTKVVTYTQTRKEELYDYFKNKYPNASTDFVAVAVGDDDALDFSLTYHDSLLSGLPLIFEGVNDIDKAKEAVKNTYCTGLIESMDFDKNIKMANDLIPDADKINIIYDNTSTGLGQVSQFNSDYSISGSDLPINYINTSELTKSEFIETLKNLDSKSLNFYFISTEFKDMDSSQAETMDLVRDYSAAPMFNASDVAIGSSMVGGYCYSHYQAGVVTGEIITEVIKGISPALMGLNANTSSSYIIDCVLAEKYGMDLAVLDSYSNVQYLNKKISFWESNRTVAVAMIVGSCASFIIILAVIGFAMALRKKNKKLEKSNQSLSASEKKLNDMTKTDYLTGIYNARKFHGDLFELLRNKSPFYLVIIDVNNFKAINDLFGHRTGDNVISTIAAFLMDLTDSNSDVYRFGGDEFAFILRGYTHERAEKLAKSILEIKKEGFLINNSSLNIFFSVGLAESKEDDKNENDVIYRADSAMYYVKKRKVADYAFFDENKMKNINDASFIANKIGQAIENKKVYMLFQPVYNLRTDKYDSVEALMRIDDIKGGPAEFIPIAEHSNYITMLGRIAVDQSLDFAVLLNKAGLGNIKVAVNFSASQLGDRDFFKYVDEQAQAKGVSTKQLKLEFTESVSFNKGEEKIVEECKKRDITMALDDFGSGYSSINSMANTDFTYVKFDKCIIDAMFSKINVINLISFAHSYGSQIIAEGVEDKEQMEYLKTHGCDFIQGFYFSKAIPANDCIRLIKKQNLEEKIEN